MTVVSGLARGIDSAAHRGAVDARARTVAVLGCGIDVVYPPENRTLYEEILANGGSIVTEEPPGTPPLAHNFPARNRIISGMSRAVLLVEAARHSGAMSTVRHAIDQSRDVMALPGQADSVLSSSPHALIRDGARLVASAKEILEDLGWDRLEIDGRRPSDEPLQLTAAEQQVYKRPGGRFGKRGPAGRRAPDKTGRFELSIDKHGDTGNNKAVTRPQGRTNRLTS